MQCGLLAFISATVFLRTTLDTNSIEDGSLYLSMIFFSLVYIMFNSYAEISLTVRGRLCFSSLTMKLRLFLSLRSYTCSL